MQNMYFYIAYNQSADKNTPHPPKMVEIVFACKKGHRLVRFAFFFRGLASGELKVNKLPAWLPMNVFNLKEKTMMH